MNFAHRWEQLWTRLGHTDPALKTAGENLIKAYDAKGRFYHNKTHLEDVLRKLDFAKEALEHTNEIAHLTATERQSLFDTIELSLWYHDAVYDATAKDNEAQSRDMFLADAQKFGLSEKIQKDVARLIDLTATHTKAAALDEKIMTDCDLAILGADQRVFEKYDQAIRKEYAHVPEDIYNAVRPQVLSSFLNQPQIFKTKAFQEVYEDTARANLAAAITPVKPATTPKTPKL